MDLRSEIERIENQIRRTHPLRAETHCRQCGAETVLLPSYPGDYFDCATCGASWAPTRKQIRACGSGASPQHRA